MKSMQIGNYIFLGISLRYFQDVRAAYPIFGDGEIDENIEEFFNNLKKFP